MTSYTRKLGGGYRAEVDLESQVLAVEVIEQARWHHGLGLDDDALDPENPPQLELPVSPSVAGAVRNHSCVPLMALARTAKLFDDWLYATIDASAHGDDGPVMGKRALVNALRERLDAAEADVSARALLHAAWVLVGGRIKSTLPPKLRLSIRRLLTDFDASPVRSRPIGFYTDSEELSQLFRHDRILQCELPPEAEQALAAALADEALALAYRWHLRLARELTGPLAKRPPGATEDAKLPCALFPPSRAPETELVKRLYGDRPVPEGFRLLDEVVTRVQDGRLDLTPGGDGGWYARQLHALEPLLRSADARLEIGPRYAGHLEELFKGLMGFNRETHIKQLEIPMVGAGLPEVEISPRLRLEPFPVYYERIASAYGWLLTRLQGLFGEDLLRTEVDDRHGRPTCIQDALADMECLFAGAAILSREDLGHPEPRPGDGLLRAARARATRYCASWADDPELETDARMMVPLYYDIERQRTRVQVVRGFATESVAVSFARQPQVRVRRFGIPVSPGMVWSGTAYDSPCPVSFECDVRQVLDRAQVRELMDAHPTETALRQALEAL